jgi:hypothetical protein
MLFLDYVKAFDLFAQKKIMANDGRKGFSIHLIRTVQSIVMCMESDCRWVYH